MSKEKYVQGTLTLPSELPLFNYNINFEGLRKLLEGVNVKTNSNEESIRKLQQNMQTKLPTVSLLQSEKKLNSSYLFGVRCQNYIDKQNEKMFRGNKNEIKQMGEMEQFCEKMKRLAEIVEYTLNKAEDNEQKISSDNKRYQKLIDQSFRRLEDKLNSGLDSFTKTINSYFTQTNEKVSSLESKHNTFKTDAENKINDINGLLSKKVSDSSLKGALESTQLKVKKQLESLLKNDQMQRLATVNDIKNSFKEAEKEIELKNKSVGMKLQELTQKVAKALQVNAFQLQKHKIYERLSQLKNKGDDMMRRNNEFVQFRKNYLVNNQKTKQEIIGLNEQFQKMRNKQSGFKKLQNMSDMISSLNPHLICEIGEQVKLHQKELGKLQKQLLTLQNELKNKANEKAMPQVNGGQNSDLIQKIIKQFMSNMDFEGRVKRSQKDIGQLKKKNDTFNQLEKKIYALTKEMDMGAIMKQLKKKCDEENTRKDTKILDGKIEQLFEFYKQLRREVEEKRKISKNQSFDNATLTTKRLLSANCLSCTPSTPSSRRQYGKNKMQMSVDYGLQNHKNTIYSRIGK